MLGSDHDAVTLLHYLEHVIKIPGKRVSRFPVPVEEGGRRVWRDMEEFDSSDRANANWPDVFFATIVDTYLTQIGNPGGCVGDAMSYLGDTGR